jgi:conjugal transfer/type IV secretion protein DotA/TraY
LPFLPFIYFFFAVGGWFKGIFEAMVGAPLWALAHIRIDGPGLAGQAAVTGYFMIFEIFLRPILIIFGLLASISIFAAMVSVLNQTWDLVTANLSGFDMKTENTTPSTFLNFVRGPIDEFFFTIIYTIVVYLMGMTSFKLVDIIPSNIMRWMGQAINTFSDQREDAGQTLSSTSMIGGQQAISQLGNVARGLSQKATGAGG